MKWYDAKQTTIISKCLYLAYKDDVEVKFGKTTDIAKTQCTYERIGNINMTYILTQDADKIEGFILNLLHSYRIKKDYNTRLTEMINISIPLLKFIVEWCISNCEFITSDGICRSVNTISNYQIEKDIITNLCISIIHHHNLDYFTPMEVVDIDIGGEYAYSYLFDYKDLYTICEFF